MARFVRVRVQARVLRTIDKVGGLDEYLLGGKAARLRELGMGGWKLRAMIMRTEKVKERFQRERELLGLVDGGEGAGVMGSGVGIKSEGEDEEEEDDFEDEEEDLDEREDEEGEKKDDRKVKSSEKRGLRGQNLQGQLVT
jgi:large subunit ribosomal protein L28